MPLPGWLTHAASFSIGAVASAVISLQTVPNAASAVDDGSLQDTPRKMASAPEDEAPSLLFPSMPVRLFRPNSNLVIAFDSRSRNPLFVVERLSGRTTGARASDRKKHRFREESSLLPYHRSRNGQYRRSGYDRGHLAPAGDFSYDDKAMGDTFVLTNVSPQKPMFNRSIWLRLEEFVRGVAEDEGRGSGPTTSSETWVVTGPTWLPSSVTKNDGGKSFRYSYDGIGRPPSLVAVPTHFYKVVAVVERNTKSNEKNPTPSSDGNSGELILKKFAAFVLPNSDTAANDRVRLADYIVRLTDLEAVTGLEFFPTLFGTHAKGMDANDSSVGGTYGIPIRKEIADALADDARFLSSEIESGDRNSSDLSALVPLSHDEEWSKGRQRRLKKMLRENDPIPFQHLCRKNNACFKLLSS